MSHQPSFEDLGTPLIDTTFVVVDLETTGLRPDRDRVTEVGAVKVRGGEVLGELSTLVDPGCPIPPPITAMTGISDEMVREAPRITAVLPMLLEFLGDGVFVAHNARFDHSFLSAAATRGSYRFDPLVLDTVRLARRLLRGEVHDLRLATLAQHLRARTRPDHRALNDARATVDVLHGLIERAGCLGATTVEDLRALTRSASDRRFRRIDLVGDAPRTCGVYRFLGHDDTVLYVGKATDLRARLRSYFTSDTRAQVEQLVRETTRVVWTPTATPTEAEVLELRELRRDLPRYNRRSTRPLTGVHVALTDEPFPRLSIVTRPRDSHRMTVGPFPSHAIAARFLEAMHLTTGLRPCTARLRRAQDHRPCILKDLDRCAAVCDGSQSPDAYAQVVEAFRAAIDDPTEVLSPLRARMELLARRERFEEAASLRTVLHSTAKALCDLRRLHDVGSVERIVAGSVRGEVLEVVVVEHGRLRASVACDATTEDRHVLDRAHGAAALPDDGGEADDLAERFVVLDALERPGMRLLEVTGEYCSPIAGSEQLYACIDELGQVRRSMREDRRLLELGSPRRSARRTPRPQAMIDPGGSSPSGANRRTVPSS